MSKAADSFTIVIGGQRYFIYGKTRVKITEHFPINGKSIDELITVLTQREIQETARKTV